MSQLVATEVSVRDRRVHLLEPTSLELATGELLVAYGDPGHGHTALSLALAGRLEPHGGSVTLDGLADRKALQRSVALVDVPGVSEPDDNLGLLTIVGEELAMARRPAFPKQARAWLEQQGLGEHIGSRMEDLPMSARVLALTRLAALREGVSFLVVPLPERHGELPENWLTVAHQLTDVGFGVLVTTSVGVAQHLTVNTIPLGRTA